MKKITSILVFVLIILAGVFLYSQKQATAPAPTPVVTQTEKEIKNQTSAQINQRILNNNVYITPLVVVSDSRCPSDVTCIWAGTVSLKAKLESGDTTETKTISLNTPFIFSGKSISLVKVSPMPYSKQVIKTADYKFEFSVTENILKTNGIIKGTITLSPICPVERMPPDPNCAPKGYQTTVSAIKDGKLVTTTTSNINGEYRFTLAPGTYQIEPKGGPMLPRCISMSVVVKIDSNKTLDFSCDTGIR